MMMMNSVCEPPGACLCPLS